MIHNVNCTKKSEMLKPEDLFELPSDIKRKKKRFEPKSTKEQMESFEKKYKSMTNKKAYK